MDGDSLVAVSFASATGAVRTPIKLFSSPRLSAGFDVARDGKRFLILRTEYDKTGGGITVVQNWFAEFAQRR